MTKSKEDRDEAIEQLRQFFKPGDTLYCIIRSVARSGLSRRMDYFASVNGEMRWITPFMVRAGVPDESYTSWRKRSDYDGARIDGCGMDMCFESAYRLGHKLWPKGFGIESMGGIRPTTQEEAAALAAEGKTTFRGRNGDASGWDNDSGYALKHRVL